MMDVTQAEALARKLRSMVSLTEAQRYEIARGLEELAGIKRRASAGLRERAASRRHPQEVRDAWRARANHIEELMADGTRKGETP